MLVGLAVTSIGAASAIGLVVALDFSLWLSPSSPSAACSSSPTTSSLAGLHTDLWFGLAWGGFPVLTAAFAQTGRVEPEAVLAALAAVLLSLAQRAFPRRPATSADG